MRGASGANGSEDVRRLLSPSAHAYEGDLRTLRRHGREVHRRRGDGRVRRPDRARGRSGAGHAGRRWSVRDTLAEDGELEVRSDQRDRRGARRALDAGPSRGEGMVSGDARRHRCSGSSPPPRMGSGLHRRNDVPTDGTRDRATGSEPIDAARESTQPGARCGGAARAPRGVGHVEQGHAPPVRARAELTALAQTLHARARRRAAAPSRSSAYPGIGKSPARASSCSRRSQASDSAVVSGAAAAACRTATA